MKLQKVVLKLSGEALAGDKKTGFSEEVVKDVAAQVKKVLDQGIQVGVVIGGGNFWRGRTSEGMDRVKADQIGMLATIMNCIYSSSYVTRQSSIWKQDTWSSSREEPDIRTSQRIWL